MNRFAIIRHQFLSRFPRMAEWNSVSINVSIADTENHFSSPEAVNRFPKRSGLTADDLTLIASQKYMSCMYR